MPLEDKDIFQAVCSLYADKGIDVIMAEYAKAKKINSTIEKRDGLGANAEFNAPEPEIVETVEVIEPEPVEPPKKRYTKRMLKVKPQDAITEDYIKCCICGEERQSLTAKHLANHEITVEDYKKLCGYPANLPLMSKKRLAKSKEIIARAQQARLDKRAAMSDD